MSKFTTLLDRCNSTAAVSAFPSADAFARLLGGFSLTATESRSVFADLVAGALSDSLMAAMFVALRMRGETAEELTGAALALRAAAIEFPAPDTLFADSCGTGGDSSGSINVSTAAGLIAAASGLPLIKHGNGSFTSRCGSADVLRMLGAKLDLSPARSRQVFDEVGFCFLFAPLYHPGIAHAGPVRRALKVRTIMNLLGPCLNPARPEVQLVGVPEARFVRPVAETLRALGTRRALIVHGSGLDELALHGVTEAIELKDGGLDEYEITPEIAGVPRTPLGLVRGGAPEENARRLMQLLDGKGQAADESIVALNAGALLYLAGMAADLREGAACAADTIRSGAGQRLLRQFVEATHG
ncbi:MAG TPA: anthranilate phosphoribosyltransferase [Sphingomicrobium sp.]|nr:anthranilate phosphoribosyltransferase [Sphingomicrobium sp.]